MTLKRTYEEILDSMKTAYFNESGEMPDPEGEIVKRFEILASELFSLSCYADWIFKQAFVQSATDENLDRLGELRGCERKTAVESQGELVFSLDEASDEEVTIPVNTVCSVKGKPYMQFSTTEEGVIESGETSVTVAAASLEAGEEYNVAANSVTVMVNAPVGVSSVNNPYSFEGGYSEESDTAYRNRILRHYNILPNGLNCTSFENVVLTLDYVVDCKIIPASTGASMNVVVTTKSKTLTDEQREEIVNKISIIDMVNASYSLTHSTDKYVSLTANATVMSGFDSESIISQIENRVKEVFGALRISETLPLSRLESAVSDIKGLVGCSFKSSSSSDDILTNTAKGVLRLNELAVNYIYD